MVLKGIDNLRVTANYLFFFMPNSVNQNFYKPWKLNRKFKPNAFQLHHNAPLLCGILKIPTAHRSMPT
jgi:hypothetical protein